MSVAASTAAGLIDAFVAAGVTDVIASPGSRSTPFLIAALQSESLKVRSVIDERAAGFIALGQARRTGRPTLLLCTSGTAAAHYYPAVIEAYRDEIPLLVLSADRPADLQGCDAPQTMHQQHLFGVHVRGFIELGEARAEPRAHRAVGRQAARAYALAVGRPRGPVHVNAAARKPLEPQRVTGVPERSPKLHRSIVVGRSFADEAALEHVAERLAAASRPLLVAGPASSEGSSYRREVADISELAGAPLIADCASQLRFGQDLPKGLSFDHASIVMRSESIRARLAPDLIVQIGRPPTSSSWIQFLAEYPDVELIALAGSRFIDVESTADLIVQGEIGDALRRLRTAMVATIDSGESQNESWREEVGTLNDVARDAMDDACGGAGCELNAARIIGDCLPSGVQIMLGNSLPIRHFDALVAGDERELVFYSQRGVSGIDGLIAGAAGTALDAAADTWLVLGDVSFAHDVSGLAAACSLGVRLRVIILNNAGGRIFDQLPVAGRDDLSSMMSFYHTPPSLDVAGLSTAVGAKHQSARTGSELREMLQSPLGSGVEVLEVMVDPESARRGMSQMTEFCEAKMSLG